MDKNEIIKDIKKNSGAEIASLQKKFNISYKEAKSVIDELVADGTLVFESGIKYVCTRKIKDAYNASRAHVSPREELFGTRRRSLLERRRYDWLHSSNDDDDDDDDDRIEDEIDDEELHYRALKLIIEKNSVSVSMFQRSLPIGYVKSCELIDWMESEGYISGAKGYEPRQVLITEEEFDNLYNKPKAEPEDNDFDFDFDDDDTDDEDDEDEDNDFGALDAELEKKIDEYEKYLKEVEEEDAPVSADVVPSHSAWEDEQEFLETVMERLERLVRLDKSMGQQGAVKTAEACLWAIRDTQDKKLIQVYRRLVYELKNLSPHLYRQLKRRFNFG